MWFRLVNQPTQVHQGSYINMLIIHSDQNRLQSELDSLIELTNRKDQLNNEKIEASKFDYTVDIKLKTEAEVVSCTF